MASMIPLFASAIATTPLPDPTPPRPWIGGDVELSIGAGLWQMPSHSRGDTEPFPRVNGNAYAMTHVGRLLLGVHGAAWQVPSPTQRLSGWRVEPRVGLAVGLWRTARLDLTAGLALDVLWSRVVPGPVLAATTRWFPGKSPGSGLFVLGEARLAPRYSHYQTMMLCTDGCNQTYINNPGGTGVLVGAGWAFDDRSPRRMRDSNPGAPQP